jgi:hypothetical protein
MCRVRSILRRPVPRARLPARSQQQVFVGQVCLRLRLPPDEAQLLEQRVLVSRRSRDREIALLARTAQRR